MSNALSAWQGRVIARPAMACKRKLLAPIRKPVAPDLLAI